GVDAKTLDVVELLHQPGKVTDTVTVRIEKRFDVELVDDRVLVPEWIGHHRKCMFLAHHAALPSGRIRHTANGITAGSSRMCCTFPVQVKLRSVIKSVTITDAPSSRPHSHRGTSMSHSCGKRGSRSTAARMTFCRSSVAFE